MLILYPALQQTRSNHLCFRHFGNMRNYNCQKLYNSLGQHLEKNLTTKNDKKIFTKFLPFIPHPPSQGFSFWLRISFIPFMNSLNTRLPIVHLAHIQAQGWVKIWEIFVQGEMLSENKCNILWQRSLISRHLFISHSYYTAVKVFLVFQQFGRM